MNRVPATFCRKQSLPGAPALEKLLRAWLVQKNNVAWSTALLIRVFTNIVKKLSVESGP
jgi:hypothetical protein